MKTMKVKQSILIKLPVEETFAYMRDLENLNMWSNAALSVRNVSPEAEQEEMRVRGNIWFLGRWSEITLEIIECRANEYLTVKGTSGVAPCLFSYQFEAGEDGGTLLVQEAVIYYMEGRVALSEAAINEAIHSQLAEDLLTLKGILEARPSASQDG